MTKTDNFWLAIPTPAADVMFRNQKLNPGIWERRTGLRLRFVHRQTGPSLLVADNVRIGKTGRIHETVTRRRNGTSYSRLAERIVTKWERQPLSSRRSG